MVADLDMPVTIVGVPTYRDADGLAMSSRNRYLRPEQRPTALALSRALAAGVGGGSDGRDAVLEAAREVLHAQPALTVDRLDLVDPDHARRRDPRARPGCWSPGSWRARPARSG